MTPGQRVHLVTGATDGIGRQTALELLRRGHRVWVHGRTLPKAERACDALVRESGTGEALPLAAELGSLSQVRAMAEVVLAKSGPLDVLLNNAGIFETTRKLSEDGFELTLAVNHFAPFLLTHLLLPKLRESAQGRIVNVSSIAHVRGSIDLADLGRERRYDGYEAYAGSKLANVLFTCELARRLAGTRVTVNALHPGVISTKLLHKGFGPGGSSVEKGARTSVKLAIDPAMAQVTGRYFVDERETPASRESQDRELQRALYDVSCQLTGVPGLDPVA